MGKKAFRRRVIVVCAGLAGWFGLMCSPIGESLAVATILVLIVVFFVLGFIKVQQPTDRF